jgi:23S rRNA pseudouridine1911/1915/1917 synthase
VFFKGVRVEELIFTVENFSGRADVYLASVSEVSRSQIRTVADEFGVKVNGRTVKASHTVVPGDTVHMALPAPRPLSLEPQDIPLEIVYEDEYLAVINKPQGLVVHPAAGSESGTLVNALLFRLSSLSSINGVIRPGIVHRLDKNTSGLLVVAKTDAAHRKLAEDIAEKETKRLYFALLDGNVKDDDGVIEAAIARSPSDRKKMAVVTGGRSAVTLYRVLERFGKYTFVEFELKTGRTHQIRVHARHIGHPVAGDGLYGGSDEFKLKGQLLHAHRLVLTHPVSGGKMIFEAALPDYFDKVLASLRLKSRA